MRIRRMVWVMGVAMAVGMVPLILTVRSTLYGGWARAIWNGIEALFAVRAEGWGFAAFIAVMHFAPGMFLGLLTMALLLRRASRADGETRCRKCRYILRGLSRPECPECGEII